MPKATVLAFKNNKDSFCIILKLLYTCFLGLGAVITEWSWWFSLAIAQRGSVQQVGDAGSPRKGTRPPAGDDFAPLARRVLESQWA